MSVPVTPRPTNPQPPSTIPKSGALAAVLTLFEDGQRHTFGPNAVCAQHLKGETDSQATLRNDDELEIFWLAYRRTFGPGVFLKVSAIFAEYDGCAAAPICWAAPYLRRYPPRRGRNAGKGARLQPARRRQRVRFSQPAARLPSAGTPAASLVRASRVALYKAGKYSDRRSVLCAGRQALPVTRRQGHYVAVRQQCIDHRRDHRRA